jgi:hypothetical protein
MRKILTIITFVLSLMLIVNITLCSILTIKIPDASAAVNPANQTNLTSSLSKNSTSVSPIAKQQVEQVLNRLSTTLPEIKNNSTAALNQALNVTSQQEKITKLAQPSNSTAPIISFGNIITSSTIGIAIVLILPLLASMILTYHQGL